MHQSYNSFSFYRVVDERTVLGNMSHCKDMNYIRYHIILPNYEKFVQKRKQQSVSY